MSRLDMLLVQRNLAPSRARAAAMIKSGNVAVAGAVVTKPSYHCGDDADIEVTPDHPYVGRGGLKLEAAIKSFGIECTGKTAADVGASTGGFTHCLLRHGAAKVFAIDIGHHQLAESLKADKRVINMEGRDFRAITAEELGGPVDILCCDVSFISLAHVADNIREITSDSSDIILLMKPQFESETRIKTKGGVIKDISTHRRIMADKDTRLATHGLYVHAARPSPIKGGDGNIEYLFYCKKTPSDFILDMDALINDAFGIKRKENEKSVCDI